MRLKKSFVGIGHSFTIRTCAATLGHCAAYGPAARWRRWEVTTRGLCSSLRIACRFDRRFLQDALFSWSWAVRPRRSRAVRPRRSRAGAVPLEEGATGHVIDPGDAETPRLPTIRTMLAGSPILVTAKRQGEAHWENTELRLWVLGKDSGDSGSQKRARTPGSSHWPSSSSSSTSTSSSSSYWRRGRQGAEGPGGTYRRSVRGGDRYAPNRRGS